MQQGCQRTSYGVGTFETGLQVHNRLHTDGHVNRSSAVRECGKAATGGILQGWVVLMLQQYTVAPCSGCSANRAKGWMSCLRSGAAALLMLWLPGRAGDVGEADSGEALAACQQMLTSFSGLPAQGQGLHH